MQRSFSDLVYAAKNKVTRRDVLESVRGEEFEGFRLSRETDRLTSGGGCGGGTRRTGRVEACATEGEAAGRQAASGTTIEAFTRPRPSRKPLPDQ